MSDLSSFFRELAKDADIDPELLKLTSKGQLQLGFKETQTICLLSYAHGAEADVFRACLLVIQFRALIKNS